MISGGCATLIAVNAPPKPKGGAAMKTNTEAISVAKTANSLSEAIQIAFLNKGYDESADGIFAHYSSMLKIDEADIIRELYNTVAKRYNYAEMSREEIAEALNAMKPSCRVFGPCPSQKNLPLPYNIKKIGKIIFDCYVCPNEEKIDITSFVNRYGVMKNVITKFIDKRIQDYVTLKMESSRR